MGGERKDKTRSSIVDVSNLESLGLTEKQEFELLDGLHTLKVNYELRGLPWGKLRAVCYLGVPIPLPVHMKEEDWDKPYSKFLKEAFVEETGTEFDPQKNIAVPMREDPRVVGGCPRCVILEFENPTI